MTVVTDTAVETSLAGLDPEQREAVLAPRGPVCVLAGAGTGKTRTITRRIAHLAQAGHVRPGQVLAVTFTARAAGEMRTRLQALGVGGVQARTFHAAALRQLRYFWPHVVGGEVWEVLEGKLRVVGQAASRVGVSTSRESLRDLASEIEWAKACLVPADGYAAAAARTHRDTPAPPEDVAKVYETYEALKNRAEALDFDDLLLHTAAALEEHESVAHEFRERYRCFVVDEYQDVTPAQQRLLTAWLGGRDDLTVVGDANQTIYSFAGASPGFLLDFPRTHPDATVVRLVRDYRSTPQVVGAANTVIGAARGRAAGSRLQLEGQRPPGPAPDFAEHDDEPAEAAAVAAAVRSLVDDGVPPAEIAILYRVNAQSEAYEQALGDAGIAYQVRGGERFFQRAEVRSAVAALRTLAARAPAGTTGADLVSAVRAVLGEQGLTAEPPPGGSDGAARQRWESLSALAELAAELVATVPGIDLPGFVAELAARAQAQQPPTVQGVTLASLHAAKGLEWDAVFLVGLADGTLPIQHADGDDAAVEEERRLFYVGVTRARVHLRCSWALSRAAGGRRSRRRSRFLYGLVPESHPAARVPGSGGGVGDGGARRGKPACRVCGKPLTASATLGRCAEHPSDVDVELLDALKAWRSQEAKARSVPAYVVFTDATLVALAEQRPADQRGLVAIPGIGASKLERYGADVLDLVREHATST